MSNLHQQLLKKALLDTHGIDIDKECRNTTEMAKEIVEILKKHTFQRGVVAMCGLITSLISDPRTEEHEVRLLWRIVSDLKRTCDARMDDFDDS